MIWHPNIDETGAVCLSILRGTSLDGTGWAPTRTLKDVVWGVFALFTVSTDFIVAMRVMALSRFK